MPQNIDGGLSTRAFLLNIRTVLAAPKCGCCGCRSALAWLTKVAAMAKVEEIQEGEEQGPTQEELAQQMAMYWGLAKCVHTLLRMVCVCVGGDRQGEGQTARACLAMARQVTLDLRASIRMLDPNLGVPQGVPVGRDLVSHRPCAVLRV